MNKNKFYEKILSEKNGFWIKQKSMKKKESRREYISVL